MALTPIDEYLSKLLANDSDALEHLRQVIKAVVPDAEELITYQIPTFKINGKAVAGFAAYKNHLSYFPFSGSLLDQFKDETADYKQTKGALHFTTDKPLPDDLIKQMVYAKLLLNTKVKSK